jgi:hypothetical protein
MPIQHIKKYLVVTVHYTELQNYKQRFVYKNTILILRKIYFCFTLKNEFSNIPINTHIAMKPPKITWNIGCCYPILDTVSKYDEKTLKGEQKTLRLGQLANCATSWCVHAHKVEHKLQSAITKREKE